ncbi:MAG TPA: prepilin-type N-terminal cleavage/methylation domain-containing protein [Pirellulaceae bacterium]|nr:prepilin-type N-terminal cleavage/methylation domain-containing protein [Pirellulaceae bacterium]
MRRGFTLLEMLLVLAILVAVAALAAPALKGVIEGAKLRSAADTVRTEWMRAHVKAMKTGRIQVFRYEIGGTKYTIQPWIAGDDALESSAPAVHGFEVADEAQDTANTGMEHELPEGTTFVGGDALVESRSLAIEQATADSTSSAAEWSRPILFYPDGSTSDAYVIVGNERKVGLRVGLRGMTGAASVSDVMELEEGGP